MDGNVDHLDGQRVVIEATRIDRDLLNVVGNHQVRLDLLAPTLSSLRRLGLVPSVPCARAE